MLRYGVFNLGQLWFVVGASGPERGFPSRRAALEAAGLILAAHRANGEAAELLVQDEVGRLTILAEVLLQDEAAEDEPVARMRPARVNLHLVD